MDGFSPFANSVPYDPYLGYPKGIGSEDPEQTELSSGLLGNRDESDSSGQTGGRNSGGNSANSASANKEPEDLVEDEEIPPPPSRE